MEYQLPKSPWRIRVFKVNDEVSFKYPMYHVVTHDELKEFIRESGLTPDDYEKTFFLSVGDVIKYDGKRYKVVKVYLKLYEYEQMNNQPVQPGYTESELHALIGVEPM